MWRRKIGNGVKKSKKLISSKNENWLKTNIPTASASVMRVLRGSGLGWVTSSIMFWCMMFPNERKSTSFTNGDSARVALSVNFRATHKFNDIFARGKFVFKVPEIIP